MVQVRKRFGQNFLRDQRVLERIVAAIHPLPGDQVLEIGPGQGALTRLLNESGCHLQVVEIDRDLVHSLSMLYPNLEVISADMLKVTLASLPLSPPIRVVGNLPYNISTPLLFHLFEELPLIRDMYFMLQLEVVERMVASPGSKTYGRLSVMSQYFCNTELVFEVPPTAFVPQPKVMSAIVRLVPKQERAEIANDLTTFRNLVNQAFSMRRKTLRNALKGFCSAEQIESVKLNPGLRPENLSTDDYVKLSNLAGNGS